MRLGGIVVAVSESDKEYLISRGFNPKRLVTILNGPNQTPREKWHSNIAKETFLETPSIMVVGGLHERKGVKDILLAFSQLHKNFPQWHLNIVGDGPDRTKLENLARELNLSNTHFLGHIPTPQHLLKKSDIFISASYAEPFGLSTAEAREAGCAIIATAVGGTPEVLNQGEAGILVEPGHPDQINHELRKLLSDSDTLHFWKERSKTGADYFNVFRLAKDYNRIYTMFATYDL